MRKKIKLFLILVVVGICLSGCKGKENYAKQDDLKITAFDVGKADALLVEDGKFSILIDTGEKNAAKKLLSELGKRNIEKLDYMIITHYDKDHVGAASDILKNINVDYIICPDYDGTRDEYKDFCRIAKDRMQIAQMYTFICGEMTVTIYPEQDPKSVISDGEEYDNDMSLVTMLEYGNKRFLFTGDIENKRISQMLDQEEFAECDWIKIPHHGKYSKYLKDMLKRVKPKYAVISTSEEEAPAKKLLSLLEEHGIAYYVTMNGDVTTVCDREKIWIE